MDKKRNSIEFKIHGCYALFSDPIMRVGGEKFSYQVPTYQALVGVAESVYWKPTFVWIIDAVRVMKKIQTESKGVKPLKMSGGNELSYYTYLRDVKYQVLAHFEWNLHRPELEADRDENKHHNIAKRCVKKGGRRDVFLGTRECQGYVEPCVFGEGDGFYDKYGELDFGVMFHGFDYPDDTGKAEFGKRLWRAKMTDGVIAVPRPDDPSLFREPIHPMEEKRFAVGRNFSLPDNDPGLADLMEEDQA
jgi:CRISPR-associated protein Cas5d